jgi:mannose-6-phosphate isomerase
VLPRVIPNPDPAALKDKPDREPFRIEPTFSPRIWGSCSLAPLYPEKTNLAEPIGEAWLTDINCRVANGAFAGKTLAEAWREMPAEWRGANFAEPGDFPLLVKFIFPTDKLSIQVHPDDAYASIHEKAAGGRGKTEMWHAVSVKPGASLLLGLRAGVTREKFLEALQNHTLEDLFHRLFVHAGDTFFVPARTPHTIGADMVICEVQQYSDLTYRVYDYGRVDASGKPRELHIEKALAVMNFDSTSGGKVPPRPWIKGRESAGLNHLVECAYFSVDRIDVDRMIHFNAMKPKPGPGHFGLLVVLSGEGFLTWRPARHTQGSIPLKPGDCWFVPANTFEGYAYRSNGKISVLTASVP